MVDKMVAFWQPKNSIDSGQIFFILFRKRCSNAVAALKLHTKMMEASLLGSDTSNSYSEHKLLFNDDNTSDSITSLFSDDIDLGLD